MDVRCNWRSENDLTLDDVIQESLFIPEGDLAELLDENKCMSLVPRTAKSIECTIEITKTNSKLLNSFLILSEAKVVEVFCGPYYEYYNTFNGENVGDFGDSSIFKVLVPLEKSINCVKLNLKRFVQPESLWIYGFYVQTKSVQLTSPIQSCFSEKRLASLLQEKKVKLSQKAESFQHFLGDFNNSKFENPVVTSQGGYPPTSLMAMMMSSSTNHSFSNSNEENNSGKSNCKLKAFLENNENKYSQIDTNLPLNNMKSFDKRQLAFSCENKMSDYGLDEKVESISSKLNSLLLTNDGSNENKKLLQQLLNLMPERKSLKMSKNVKTNDFEETHLGLPLDKESSCRDKNFDLLESYIENKLEAMEKRIVKRIDDHFNKMNAVNNEKFEEILSKINCRT